MYIHISAGNPKTKGVDWQDTPGLVTDRRTAVDKERPAWQHCSRQCSNFDQILTSWIQPTNTLRLFALVAEMLLDTWLGSWWLAGSHLGGCVL
jgi:hypothetical protein